MKKKWAALLFGLTASQATWANAAKIADYQVVHRTYVDLSQIDLSSCQKSLQSDGHRLSCQVSWTEPGLIRDALNILGTEQYLFEIDIRVNAQHPGIYFHATFTESFVGPNPLVGGFLNGKYEDDFGNEVDRSADEYSWPNASSVIRSALIEVGRSRRMNSYRVLALDSTSHPSSVEDQVLGPLWIAEQRHDFDLKKCGAVYKDEYLDNWPWESYWHSLCEVQEGQSRNWVGQVFFNPSDLPCFDSKGICSPRLTALSDQYAAPSLYHTDFPTDPTLGSNPLSVIISVRGGGYTAELQTGPSTNIPFARAEPYLNLAFKQQPTGGARFFWLDSEQPPLDSSETKLGRIVLMKNEQGQEWIDLE